MYSLYVLISLKCSSDLKITEQKFILFCLLLSMKVEKILQRPGQYSDRLHKCCLYYSLSAISALLVYCFPSILPFSQQDLKEMGDCNV